MEEGGENGVASEVDLQLVCKWKFYEGNKSLSMKKKEDCLPLPYLI